LTELQLRRLLILTQINAGPLESVKRRIRFGEIRWAIWVSNFDQTATENERTQISGAAIPTAETVRREGHALFAAYRPTNFARTFQKSVKGSVP